MHKVLVPIQLTEHMRERMAHIEDGPSRSYDEVWSEMIDAAFSHPLPSQDSIWMDLRHARATQITGHVMNAIGKFFDTDPEQRNAYLASNALYDLFYKCGAEVVSDERRAEAGLPARDLKGWTAQELAIMDAKRIQTMFGPIEPLIVERAPR